MRRGFRAAGGAESSSSEARSEVEAFLAALDEDDDVQHLYVGLA